jgi:hypothetical protein
LDQLQFLRLVVVQLELDIDNCGDGSEAGQHGREERGWAYELARLRHSCEHHSLEDDVESNQLVQIHLGRVATVSIGLKAQFLLRLLFLQILQVQVQYKHSIYFVRTSSELAIVMWRVLRLLLVCHLGYSRCPSKQT